MLNIKAHRMRRISAPLRNFLFLMGHALNEMNYLYRCMFAIDNEIDDIKDASREVALHQHLFFLRMHYSKCYETWKIYNRHKKHLSQYVSKACEVESVCEAKDSLEHYFLNKNCVAKQIRNKFGFHFPIDAISNYRIESFEENDQLSLIIGKSRGNCHYTFFDFLAWRAMEKEIFNIVEDSNMQRHIDELHRDHLKMDHFLSFFDPLIAQILMAEFSAELDDAEQTYVRNVATKQQLRLSYFFSTNDTERAG